MGHRRLALVLIIGLCSLPATVAAQTSAWTFSKGRLWLKSAVYYQTTTERFCTVQDASSPAFQAVGCSEAGDRAPFDPFINGEVDALAIFTDIAYGLTDRIQLTAKLPFYHLQFTNLADPDRPATSRLGDVSAFLTWQVWRGAAALSMYGGAKLPTGRFNIDAEAVNVSEGQWDLEAGLSFGKSLWPFPGYVNVSAGYRLRFDNPDFENTFGDEFSFNANAGVQATPRLHVKAEIDWLRGLRPTLRASGATLEWRRELLSFSPTLMYSLMPSLQLESGLRFALAGRDFPAAAQVMAALSYNLTF